MGVMNKAKTRDAEEANIVSILSRSAATWSLGWRDYHVDAGQQILSDRQHFFSDSTEVSITTF